MDFTVSPQQPQQQLHQTATCNMAKALQHNSRPSMVVQQLSNILPSFQYPTITTGLSSSTTTSTAATTTVAAAASAGSFHAESPTLSSEPSSSEARSLELLARDPTQVRDEIATFMATHRILKSEICALTQLTSSYLNFWFENPSLAGGSSNRSVRLIYQWYADELKKKRSSAEPKGFNGSLHINKVSPQNYSDHHDISSNHDSSMLDNTQQPPAVVNEASENVWPSACLEYLQSTVQEHAVMDMTELRDVCGKCTSLIREFYAGGGIISNEEVTPRQLTAYLQQRHVYVINFSSSSSSGAAAADDASEVTLHCTLQQKSLGDEIGQSQMSQMSQQQQQHQHQQFHVDPLDISELMRRDLYSLRDEIKDFLSRQRISQQTVSTAVNSTFSQNWLSRWLNEPMAGGHRVEALYQWYMIALRRV